MITKTSETLGNGIEIEACRVDNDVSGHPRYVVHYLDFARKSESYNEVAARLGKRFGTRKYMARWFGGGIVFQSYNLRADLQRFFEASFL